MTAIRSRRETKIYEQQLKTRSPASCPFCTIQDQDSGKQVVAATKSFSIIKNIFPYSLWDSQGVADHLMIVPKKHIVTLSKLTDSEALEYAKLLIKYEEQGYNVYSRAPGSVLKSVLHQHTHLIRPKGNPRKLVFLLRKPYIRFIF